MLMYFSNNNFEDFGNSSFTLTLLYYHTSVLLEETSAGQKLTDMRARIWQL